MATIVTGESFKKDPRQLKQQQALNSTVSGHSDSDYYPKSGFCSHTGIYRSLFKLDIPRDHNLDVASFILSKLPPQHISETRAALIDSTTGSSITYSHLNRSTLSLSAALHHGLGLRKGDVILLLLSPTSSILYPAICLAILAIGAIITPADPAASLTTNEVAKQVHNFGAKLAISSLEDAHKVEAAGIPVLTTTSTPRPQHDGKYPAAGTGSGMWPLLSVEELIECGDVLEVAVGTRITQSDVAVLFSSSSSSSLSGTSKSKGVLRTCMLTHGDLISMSMIMKWGVEKEIISSSAAAAATDENVFLCSSPSHVYGLAFVGLGLLCVGTTMVVMSMSDPFDSQAMMEAVEKHRISNILAAPTAVLLALNHDGSGGRRNLSLLRRASSMGTDREVGSKFRRMFPWVVLREGYGIGMTVFASEEEARDRRGSAGQLLPLLEGKVVELKSRRALGPGAVGELWLRGPTVRVMEGGDQKEDKSDEAVAAAVDDDDDDDDDDRDGGWVRTGDLAYFDADGFLYIVDRIKDLINHNGYQVSPTELEAILATHPQILDAAVIPIPDQKAGHVPMAYVVRASAESTLTCEEVIQFAATRVAPYKKIEKVAFINAIPKSATGRILRTQLAAQNKQAIIPAKL